MTEVIWKYTINEPDMTATFDMPPGAKILSAQCQDHSVSIWALVSPADTTEPRTVELVMTGQSRDFKGLHFIDTVQAYGGEFIMHVFEQEQAND